ncbi:Zn-dependent hydrolase [Mesorhizobium loti]|nr:Zn-dependent hydrolase [Mesorhizobium loti]PLP60771.1 Zn-dependent hydrolase [Mesorhizobium loti]
MSANLALIDSARLMKRHKAMMRIGATGRGGVNRLALSPEDTAARTALLEWAVSRGFSASIDPAGNLFVRRSGIDDQAPPVVTGSHLDSQPTGGNFDGVFGVLAAFEALEALEDRLIQTMRPIELVVWMNEEGARFAPTTMGSGAFAGVLPLPEILTTRDGDGITVADALATSIATLEKSTPLARRPLGTRAHAYIETHIEQGPILDAADIAIGIVTGVQGLRQFEIVVSGVERHAGTTPKHQRKDALASARAIITAIEAECADDEDLVRFTVGRMEVRPGVLNTIPSEVVFTVDLRHPQAATLDRLAASIETAARTHAAPCTASVRPLLASAPTVFDPALIGRIAEACDRLGYSRRDLISGATHDAKHLADRCASGMIFIPCRDGISHNEAESAEPEHMIAGAAVLAEVVLGLAME